MDTALFHPLVDETYTNLVKEIRDFPEKYFNEIPFEGSWTAGQLCQHLVMSNKGFLLLLKGEVKPTGRDPYKWVETIRRDFLDFSQKNTSPDTVNPIMKEYDRNKILNQTEKIFSELGTCINGLDVTLTCTMFELPLYGFLTRIEAVAFMIYHSKRHTVQLETIRKKFS